MCQRLQGKVAIVTGGNGYLGSYHCRYLAREGAKVVVAARNPVSGHSTVDAVRAEGGEAVFMELDVTDMAQAQRVVEETVATFGRVDILVNNAALTVGMRKPWTEFTPEDWDRKLSIDVKGSYLCARAVFPFMKAQHYGKIINIASQTAVSAPRNFLPHVSAKAGVIGFTRALATEVGEYGINVNVLIVGAFLRWDRMTEEQRQEQLDRQAFKRLPDPNDLSPVVVFLASDDSQWITGQAIAVCGGAVRTGG